MVVQTGEREFRVVEEIYFYRDENELVWFVFDRDKVQLHSDQLESLGIDPANVPTMPDGKERQDICLSY